VFIFHAGMKTVHWSEPRLRQSRAEALPLKRIPPRQRPLLRSFRPERGGLFVLSVVRVGGDDPSVSIVCVSDDKS
jgi:hypothetical protein